MLIPATAAYLWVVNLTQGKYVYIMDESGNFLGKTKLEYGCYTKAEEIIKETHTSFYVRVMVAEDFKTDDFFRKALALNGGFDV